MNKNYQNDSKRIMNKKKELILKVDPQSRIGIDDVINMLKGLRNQTFFEVVRTKEKNDLINNDSKSFYNEDKTDKTKLVTGNTDLPQIRELNEIASILRSMENKQNYQLEQNNHFAP